MDDKLSNLVITKLSNIMNNKFTFYIGFHLQDKPKGHNEVKYYNLEMGYKKAGLLFRAVKEVFNYLITGHER